MSRQNASAPISKVWRRVVFMGFVATSTRAASPGHVVDLVGADRQDHANLIAPSVPRVRATHVALGEGLDVLCTTFGGGLQDASADRVVPGRVGRVAYRHGDTRIALDVLHL